MKPSREASSAAEAEGYDAAAMNEQAAAPSEIDDAQPAAALLNRELSLLAFNHRVLAQSRDPSTPLLERLRFLTIASSNLDEFFEIRVAGLKQQIAAGVTKPGPDGLTPQAAFAQVVAAVHALVDDQYCVLNDLLLPALAEQKIRILKRSVWT